MIPNVWCKNRIFQGDDFDADQGILISYGCNAPKHFNWRGSVQDSMCNNYVEIFTPKQCGIKEIMNEMNFFISIQGTLIGWIDGKALPIWV